MIHLLYLSDHRQDPPFLRALSESEGFQVTLKRGLDEAGALLPSGWFDLCMVWAPEARLLDLNRMRKIRALGEGFALVIVAPPMDKEWEWSALQMGADLVLEDRIQPHALERILERLGKPQQAPMGGPKPYLRQSAPPFGAALSNRSALSLFRDVSRVLSESADYRRMTEQFVLKLRDLVGVHKIAIFLEQPAGGGLPVGRRGTGRMPCLAAFGIPPDLRDCLELNRHSGLGRRMKESPTVIHAALLEEGAETDQIRKEIQIPGGVIALPVNDREGNLGVAVLGDRLTGPLQEDDLQLITLLLEELGVALRNCWLHLQGAEDRQLLDDMFSALHSGCMVLSAEGETLHINRAFRAMLSGRGLDSGDVREQDLPEEIRKRVHEVRESNREPTPFFYVDEQQPMKTFRVSLLPLGLPLAPPRPLLVLLEDFTHLEQSKREEIANSEFRLTGLIAKRFAHEIRNSLVPLATHLQLFDARMGDVDFLQSLKQALEQETNRIRRFTDQMLFYSPRDRRVLGDLDLLGLVREVQAAMFGPEAELPWEIQMTGEVRGLWIAGEAKSLEHALTEVLLNARQAAPDAHPKILIRATEESMLEIHILDKGEGIDRDRVPRAFEPFYTSKNTGIGLGLPVARKILEEHGGTLEWQPGVPPYTTDFTLTLPLLKIECTEPSSSPSS